MPEALAPVQSAFVVSFSLATFSPASAEDVAGVEPDLQRKWRRRGHLPASEGDGHARFNCFDLAHLLALRLLSERGSGPLLAREPATGCAAAIAFHALSWPNAWEGADLARVPGRTWGDKSQLLRAALFGAAGIEPVPARYFAWWTSGPFSFEASLDAAFNDGVSSDERFAGVVHTLDLEAVASSFVGRAGRPFVHVETVE